MHLTCEIFILIFRQFISLFGALRVFRSHSIFTFRVLMVMGYNCVTVFSPRNFRKLSWCKILSVTVDFKEAAWEVCQIFLLLNLMVLLKCNLAAGGGHKGLNNWIFSFYSQKVFRVIVKTQFNTLEKQFWWFHLKTQKHHMKKRPRRWWSRWLTPLFAQSVFLH